MNSKRIPTVLAAALSLSVLAGCSAKTEQRETAAASSPAETSVSAESSASAETSDTTVPSGEENGTFLSGYKTFKLGSDNLRDGVWDNVISNTEAGENKSPQLKWEPVEGAGLYVIYMVDPDGGNWLHWRSDGVKETALPEGWAPSEDYVGPYPPAGSTHTYDVYVIALKRPIERLRGIFNGSNIRFEEFIRGVDTDAEGGSGNIISYGYLSGTFTSQ